MKKNLILLFLLCAVLIPAIGQEITIGIYHQKDLNTFTLSIRNGKYVLKQKGKTIGEYKKGSIFYIIKHSTVFDIRDKRNFIGSFDELEFVSTADNGEISLQPTNPSIEGRLYADNLKIAFNNGSLQLTNRVDMEKYIAGVLAAESGPGASAEYYKAQAVLTRTYTIKNMYKHGEEGFNLCDKVHCQVYKGIDDYYETFYNAATATAGEVLIGADSVLVQAPYHANCGGMTSSSGMVWQKDLPYLQPVNDPFCDKGKHYTWTASISMNSWKTFLLEQGVPAAIIDKVAYDYQAESRLKYLTVGQTNIAFRSIRERFNLKSAYFSIVTRNNEIVFEGKGYGHGAGMCQEGAMEMGRVGYTYLDIIHFYFQHVWVTDYREMEIDRY